MEPPKEELGQKVIEIPKQTARALGRSLSSLVKSQVTVINGCLEILRQNPNADQKQVSEMELSLKKFTGILDGLRNSDKARLVSLIEGAYDFQFEGEPQQGEPLFEPGEVIIDQTKMPISAAFSHNFNSILNPLIGYPELMKLKSNDHSVIGNVSVLGSQAQEIIKSLKPIQNAKNQLKITTDTQGETTISAS